MLKGLKKKKIKTMNNTMVINSDLSIIDTKLQPKQKEEQKYNCGYGEHFHDCQMGGGIWENG